MIIIGQNYYLDLINVVISLKIILDDINKNNELNCKLFDKINDDIYMNQI